MARTSSGDTIFALSSGALPSGVAVIRVSGDRSLFIAKALCGTELQPRNAALRHLKRPDGVVLDQAIVVAFAGPHSFTGEDSVEFHVHGGPAVVSAVLETIGQFSGTRLAEPGEFSMRAYLNGKLDLTALEGLSDLIAAQTELQRQAALQQAGGAHFDLYRGWQGDLIRIRSRIEAELDFSDEGDVPEEVLASAHEEVRELSGRIFSHLGTAEAAEIVRSGYRIAIIGKPNAGKSTLLNWLAGSDVAIVTPVAGTTRDVVSVDLDIGGAKVVVSDTAGLRETDDLVEGMGIERAVSAARRAHMVVLLDGGDGFPAFEAVVGQTILRLVSRVDEVADPDKLGERIVRERLDGAISVLAGTGLDELMGRIRSIVLESAGSISAEPQLTRVRYRVALERVVESLDEALIADTRYPELLAELLRQAADSLGVITGNVDVEEILGSIFSSFCIGK